MGNATYDLSAPRFFRWGWACALQHVVMGQSHPALRRAQPSGAEILGSYSRGVRSGPRYVPACRLFFAVEHGEGEGERE